MLRVLAGRYGKPSERHLLWVRLDNLASLGFWKSARVKVRRIRYSGQRALLEPESRAEIRKEISRGRLLIGLTDFGAFDAYSIEIRR